MGVPRARLGRYLGEVARWLYGGALALGLMCGCGDDGSAADGGPADAPLDAMELPPPPTFEVVPDPSVSTACEAEIPAPGRVRAKVVSCIEELPRGPLAMGRVGDVVLANSRVAVVIRAGEEAATLIGAFSGGIVDAARHGEADLVQELFMAMDLSTARPSDVVVTASGEGGVARVEVPFELRRLEAIAAALGGLGRSLPGFGVLTYELRPDEEVLRVSMRLAANAGAPALSGRPAMVLRASGAATLQVPGTGELREDFESGGSEDGGGFAGMVLESPESALGARLGVDAGATTRIAAIYLNQATDRLVIPAGEVGVFSAEIAFAATAAEAHARLTADDDLEEVRITGVEAVEVRHEGTPWLRTRIEPGGTTLRIPPGSRSYVAGFERFYQGPEVVDAAAEVTLEPAPEARLDVDATAEGDALPVRVTVVGAESELLRRVVQGPSLLRLPPGAATITLSRGYEYDWHQEEQVLVAGETRTVAADLPRVVDTTGWVAGDFHLHTELSTDSNHPVADAVRIVAGEGLEVVAATDHDFIADYGPQLREAGLDGWVLAVPGVEASDPILAHVGGYPLVRDPDRAGFGAPVWFGSNPTVLFDAIRAQGDEALGGAIVQLNHPYRRNSGWLEAIGLDPMTATVTVSPGELGLPADTPIGDFDWDVVEVFNDGAGEADERTLQAFLGLWVNGWRFAMVGNSDSHEPGSPAGSTRTLVRVPDDAPGAYDWMDIAAAFAARELSVSGGAFVEASVEGVAGDMATVRVRVQAPPYVELDRLRIYAGSRTALDEPIAPSSEVIRVDATFDVPLEGALFVMVRADGPRAARPVLPFPAFGATNPLLVAP